MIEAALLRAAAQARLHGRETDLFDREVSMQ
jgi:hypothetical protein